MQYAALSHSALLIAFLFASIFSSATAGQDSLGPNASTNIIRPGIKRTTRTAVAAVTAGAVILVVVVAALLLWWRVKLAAQASQTLTEGDQGGQSSQEFGDVSVMAIIIGALIAVPAIVIGSSLFYHHQINKSAASLASDTDDSVKPAEEPPKFPFENVELLDEGSFGEVYKVTSKEDEKLYALKVFKSDVAYQKELEGFKLAGEHENIVKGTFWTGKYGEYNALTMEFLSGGILEPFYFEPIDLEKEKTGTMVLACIAKSVLKGLDHLHRERHAVHMDIKPDNLGFNDGVVKILDLGLVRQPEASQLEASGTVPYMAPELLCLDGRRPQFDFKIDIFSLGLTLVRFLNAYVYNCDPNDKLVYKKSLCGDYARYGSLNKRKNVPIPKIAGLSDEFESFLKECLQLNPKNRMSAEKLLEHPFITKSEPCGDALRELHAKHVPPQ